MSRLSEMIKELCPNGVEYRKLEDVLKICNGSDYKKFGEGDIPVYGSGGIMTYIDTYVYDKPSVLIPRKGSLDKLYYVDVPFWTVDTIFYTKISEEVLPKYVFYYLQSQHLERLNKAGGVPSLTQTILNKVLIPVPPLPIQNEIVKLLDNFTELTAGLTATLTAELALRKKQYNFYRDSLLNFVRVDDTIVQTDRQTDRQTALRIGKIVSFMRLSELAEIGTGSSNTNEGLSEGAYPFFVRSQEVRWKNAYEYDETAIITSGDGVGVGKIFHYIEGKYALHQRAYRVHVFNERLLPRFLFYYMKTTFYRYITQNAVQSSVTSIRRPMLDKYPVPVPPLDVQQKIVSILDRFDALCNVLTQGLPAEIAARKKQYEYYRDKLLTFSRKDV